MIDLHRTPGWRKRLEEAIDAIVYAGFDWSEQHDCAIGLAGPAVFAITEVDIIEPYRGRYASERAAIRVMKKAGFADIADMTASMLPEIHPSQAREGDLAAFPIGGAFGHALGVVNGERVLVLRPEGIGSLGLLEADRAFKVG